jgi:heterodisulfide reductase subunit B
MKYAYYPGCSLHSTASEYDISFRAVCKKLNIELLEMPKWICCGTTPAHSTSRLLAVSLPVKNMIIAERMNVNEIIIPCASCFSRFKFAQYEIEEDPNLLYEVTKVIGEHFSNKVRIVHPLEVMLNKIGVEKIKSLITKDISGMKIACYYGCLLTRPPEVTKFDDCEYPMIMDSVLRAAGAQTIDWSYKTECCGAAFSLTITEMVIRLTRKILQDAKEHGADAVAVACPLCHSNLDMRQSDIEKKYNISLKLPIFFFTQLLGLAFGLAPEDLALHKHLVSPMELFAKNSFK